MISKDLIEIIFTNDGIKYKSNDLTEKFLEYLDNSYSRKLNQISIWLKHEFNNYNLNKLETFVRNNIPNWGSEFIYESLIREHE
jgi:hypothetical protein